jgi:hypothetical protein
MIIRKRIAVTIFIFLPFFIGACSGRNNQTETVAPPSDATAQTETIAAKPSNPADPAQQQDVVTESAVTDTLSGEVIIVFNYEKQSGSASNQFAVWIEDMKGNLIKTLYATRFTANGGYKNRPDSIALWVEKSGLASMSKSEVDAISSATPKAGELSYAWDLTDTNGEIVSTGEYKFFVEGTLRWKNRVYYSGVIKISNKPSTVWAEAEFIYEDADRQPALSGESPENSMISEVTASFIPK